MMRTTEDEDDVVCRCLTGEDDLESYALASEELESDAEHLLRGFLFCDEDRHELSQCTNTAALTNTTSTTTTRAGGQECLSSSEGARVPSLDSSMQNIFVPVPLTHGTGIKAQPHDAEPVTRCAGWQRQTKKMQQQQQHGAAVGTDDGSETERRDGVSDTTGEMTRSARSAEELVASDVETATGGSVAARTPRWATTSRPASAATSTNTQVPSRSGDKPPVVPVVDTDTDGNSTGTVLSKLNVYITGLPNSWNTKMLRTECLRFGEIVSAVVQHHPETNDSRQYGFVMFKTEESARRCIEYMNNRTVFADRPPLQCHYAKEDATPLAVQQKLRRTSAQGEEVLDGEVIMPVEVLATFYREVRRVCAAHVAMTQQQGQVAPAPRTQDASHDGNAKQGVAAAPATETSEEAEERQALGLDRAAYAQLQRMIQTCVVYGNHVHTLADIALTTSARALFAASPATATSCPCDDVPEPLRRVLLWQMSLPMENKGGNAMVSGGGLRHHGAPSTGAVTHKMSYVCLVFASATAASEFLRSAVTTQQTQRDKTAQSTMTSAQLPGMDAADDAPHLTTTARAAQLTEATFCRQGKVASIMTSLTTAADNALVRGLRRYTATAQPRACGRALLATLALGRGSRHGCCASDDAVGFAAAASGARRYSADFCASSAATLPPPPAALIGQAVMLNSLAHRGYPATAMYLPPPPPPPPFTSMGGLAPQGVLSATGASASFLPHTAGVAGLSAQLPPPPLSQPNLHDQQAMLPFVTLGATGQTGTAPAAPGATFVLLNHLGPALRPGTNTAAALYAPGTPSEGGGQRVGLTPCYVTLQHFSTDGVGQLASRGGAAAPATELPSSFAYSLLPSVASGAGGAAPPLLWKTPYYTTNATAASPASLPPSTGSAFATPVLMPPTQLVTQHISLAALTHTPPASTMVQPLTPEMMRGAAVQPPLITSAASSLPPQLVGHVL